MRNAIALWIKYSPCHAELVSASHYITTVPKVILNLPPLVSKRGFFVVWEYNWDMNIQNYRESKINKYPDKKTGLLMYRHEKLFDIVKTIEEFVNLSFGKELDEQQYRDSYQQLIIKLPEEYRKQNRHRFQSFMTIYKHAKNIDHNHTKNFKKALYKYFKIDYINDINENLRKHLSKISITNEKIQLERYWWTIAIHLPQEEYYKLSEWSEWHYSNKLHTIFINNKYNHEAQNILYHEHFHHLASIWLMDNEYRLDENWQYTKESIMRHKIKNEIIAQYSDSKNKDFEKNIETSMLIDWYIVSYLSHKYKKELLYERDYFHKILNKSIYTFNQQEVENTIIQAKDIKIINNIYEKTEDEKKLITDKSILEEFEKYHKEANLYTSMLSIFTTMQYDKIVPRYFTSYDQILYLFAITPLLQRIELIKYYMKLITLDETKSNLHSTLSEPHD
jgi:hypothetical protein